MTLADKNYSLGSEDGFKSAIESLQDKIYSECWDEAFASGYRACQEELVGK